ncbi:hypothetical protein K439DRAFT_1648335 [Ramaria rubella]|nr:hypothetical protein K439DRAFT_1648335 [Ramaria rubella]
MAIDVATLSLFLATPAQVQASRTVNHVQWGRGLSIEGYLKRSELLDIYEHAEDGGLMTWVLAPRSDPLTLSFLCACETFRRHAFVHNSSSHEPGSQQTFAYGIAAVFCPLQHRNKGYARYMMRLLHYVLAIPGSLPSFPLEWGSPPIPPPGAGNAYFSCLWSDIGPAFYEDCGPNPTRVGWKVKDPIETVWMTDINVQLPNDVRWLFEDDCIELWRQDSEYIKERLADRSTDSSFIRCTFLSDHGMAAYQLRRAKFFLPGSPTVTTPQRWGVTIAGTNQPTYATWIIDIRPLPVALLITRIRATPETLPVLLSAIMKAAKENNAATVEVWNLEQQLLETAFKLGGNTRQRAEHLPSLAWYGAGDIDEVEWCFNEK